MKLSECLNTSCSCLLTGLWLHVQKIFFSITNKSYAQHLVKFPIIVIGSAVIVLVKHNKMRNTSRQQLQVTN